MRDLGELLNAHLGCTHKTTEVRRGDGEFRFRHGGERYTVLLFGWNPDENLARNWKIAAGSGLFHEVVRALLPMHERHPVHITDAEYAGILDGK